jgi:hypothetical protein
MLLMLGVLLPILAPAPSPVTWAAFGRIEVGMTEEEVAAAICLPPGDYTTRPRIEPIDYFSGTFVPRDTTGIVKIERWDGDGLTIWVEYGGAEATGEPVVASASADDIEPLDVGVAGLLRWRFDRWWRSLRLP